MKVQYLISKKAIAAGAKSPDVFEQYAVLLYEAGNTQEAKIQHRKSSVCWCFLREKLFLYKGYLAIADKNWDAAISSLQKAKDGGIKEAGLYSALGKSLLQQKRL